jgi:3'-phosphoadenosine 5'-phosphosulfate sulfotransferase (PAPS reductase)/FAD synthetase|tara:strand:- start:300 stop:1046 length:747 start_codon:yes stop_codon:yes gene_type:complete
MSRKYKEHIVSLSGGIASAVAADRVIGRHGDDVELWFADTSWEDDDLYRFLDDLEVRWDREITRYKDGRTPPEVFEGEGIIGSNRFLSCTRKLKIQPFVKHIKDRLPCVVYLGLDWTESHRLDGPRERYSKMGAKVDFPLLWEPRLMKRDYMKLVDGWGIEIPLMYRRGFSHNNCGGSCFRQGAYAWRKLQQSDPDRFQWMMEWEEGMQKVVGNHTILNRGRSLRSLEGDGEQLSFEGVDDEGCFCSW